MEFTTEDSQDSRRGRDWCVPREMVKFMLLDEDNDLMIFRKFKKLSLYVLLDKQERLRQIEDSICKWESKKGSSEGFPKEVNGADGLLKEYHEALLRQRQIFSLSRPPKTLIEYLRTQSNISRNEWVPIVKGKGIDDMITLTECERGFIDKYLQKTRWLGRVSLKPRDPDLPSDINLYSETFVRQLETLTITVAFGLLVLGPIVALSYLHKTWLKLLVICVAMILASIVASALSDNSHRGSLAVIAAYTAILTVFLGNSIQ